MHMLHLIPGGGHSCSFAARPLTMLGQPHAHAGISPSVRCIGTTCAATRAQRERASDSRAHQVQSRGEHDPRSPGEAVARCARIGQRRAASGRQIGHLSNKRRRNLFLPGNSLSPATENSDQKRLERQHTRQPRAESCTRDDYRRHACLSAMSAFVRPVSRLHDEVAVDLLRCGPRQVIIDDDTSLKTSDATRGYTVFPIERFSCIALPLLFDGRCLGQKS